MKKIFCALIGVLLCAGLASGQYGAGGHNGGWSPAPGGGVQIPGPLQMQQNWVGSTGLLPHWRAALASVRGNKAVHAYNPNARIVYIGNSTIRGAGSNNTSISSGEMSAMSVPSQLASILASMGVNAHNNSGWGDQLNGTDGRFTLDGTAWTYFSTTFAGALWEATGAGTGNGMITFTPTQPVDTFVVYCLRLGNTGTFTPYIDGSAQSTVNTSGSPSQVVPFTVTTTLGTHTLGVKYASGTYVFVVGIEAYNSVKQSVGIINGGYNGSTAYQWDTSGNTGSSGIPSSYDPLTVLKALQPDLTNNRPWGSMTLTALMAARQGSPIIWATCRTL